MMYLNLSHPQSLLLRLVRVGVVLVALRRSALNTTLLIDFRKQILDHERENKGELW